jgi:hypothetical protein
MKEGNGVEVLLIACYSLRFARADLIRPLEITRIEGLDRLVTSIVAREIHIPPPFILQKQHDSRFPDEQQRT